MLKTLFAGFAVACTVVAFQSHGGAQQGRQAQAANPTDKQMAESKEAQMHIAAAMALAKPDLLKEAGVTCNTVGPRRPAQVRLAAGLPPLPRHIIEPTRVFDNLYYFGFDDVGAWALTTSQGIIMIDSLNTSEEAEQILVPGLRKVGLDPTQIKYVILGHGHFDHYGGTPYLQAMYEPRVLMGGPDWDLIDPRSSGPRPKRDMSITDGQKLTLGDTTVTLALTPGHTPGTIAILMPVKYDGKQYTALMLSGALLPADRQSLAAFEHVLNDFAKKEKAAVVLNSHPFIFGDTLAWMETIRNNPGAPHPFIYGEARFERYLNIMLECARGRIAAREYKE